jgi:hypothetical protein
VLVCIGVVDVDVDELETGVVDAAPRGVREDAEEVVVVLDAQRLFRLSQSDREVNAVRRTRRHNVAAARRRSAAVARGEGEQRRWSGSSLIGSLPDACWHQRFVAAISPRPKRS